MNRLENKLPAIEPMAYLNGDYVPVTEAKLSVFDLGIVSGATVTETLRTFSHRPFSVDEHLQRLQRSLKSVGFPPTIDLDEWKTVIETVVAKNSQLIPKSHDLGIVLFVTAGQNLTYLGGAAREQCQVPSVCVHTFPLPFELWNDKFKDGQHLVTPSVRHIPATTLESKIKSRSRIHWYLADKQARLVDANAGCLVLDQLGNLCETSTGNFYVVYEGQILTPSPRTVLGGVSQMVVKCLAKELKIPYATADIQTYEAINAEESFTSSTPYCLMPVTKINGQTIGNGEPGPVFRQLVNAWNKLVGIDILKQIEQGAVERQTPQVK